MGVAEQDRVLLLMTDGAAFRVFVVSRDAKLLFVAAGK